MRREKTLSSVCESPVQPAYAATQQLVKEFEDQFGSRDCQALLDGCDLNTAAGQAMFKEQQLGQSFYERLGYVCFGELPNYPTGFARIFMRKMLEGHTHMSTAPQARCFLISTADWDEPVLLTHTAVTMPSRSPLKVVQAQLDAYNAKDIDALLWTYAPDAEQFTLHGERLAHGHEQMRPRFLARFAEPDLHARLISRTVMANVVVDHELISRNFPEGPGTLEMLCVYEVADGLIQKASFAVGEKRLHARDDFAS